MKINRLHHVAQAAQPVELAFEGGFNFRVQAFVVNGIGNVADAVVAGRGQQLAVGRHFALADGAVHAVGASHHFQQQRGVFHRAGQGPYLIERRGEGH